MAFKNFFNDLFTGTPEEEEEGTIETREPEQRNVSDKQEAPAVKKEQTASRPAAAKPQSFGTDALELKICKPQSFAEVGNIADHLLNRCTVVLNLETTSKETARRIVDFLSGVSYSIDGQIKPVANNTFVLTPRAVSVSGEETEEIADEEVSEDPSFLSF